MTIVFNRRVAIAAALTAVTDSVVSSEDGRPKVLGREQLMEMIGRNLTGTSILL